MIPAFVIILSFQLIGEILARSLALPLPGPVIGLVGLMISGMLFPPLISRIRAVAQGVLAHLSLFFVPAGVGVVAHLDVLQRNGPALIAIVACATLLGFAAGGWAFVVVARWQEQRSHD